MIIATYLSFFPVTIAMHPRPAFAGPAGARADAFVRGRPAARCCGSCALPASLPYLFTALKITATASIVGAIVGEGPGGIRYGLGRAILFFSQQYTIAPEKLWSAIIVTRGARDRVLSRSCGSLSCGSLRRWPEGFAG